MSRISSQEFYHVILLRLLVFSRNFISCEGEDEAGQLYQQNWAGKNDSLRILPWERRVLTLGVMKGVITPVPCWLSAGSENANIFRTPPRAKGMKILFARSPFVRKPVAEKKNASG